MTTPLKISEAVSLGLHAMALMVPTEKHTRITVKKVAGFLSVSEAHLAKVMQRLHRAGLVSSTRGPLGGFALQRPADQISFLQIYEAIEGPWHSPDCLLPKKKCNEGCCILGTLMQRLDQDARRYFSKTMLSDMGGSFSDFKRETAKEAEVMCPEGKEGKQ